MSPPPLELLRIAHVLRVDPDRLADLSEVPAADLRQLRGQVSDVLLEADRFAFERTVALADHLPAPIAAKLAQVALGPGLASRAAALVSTEKAAAMASRLPADFLAELAVTLDPRRLPVLVKKIPPQRIGEITAELAKRREWVVMEGLVDQLPGPALDAALAALDEEALVEVGVLIEDEDRLAAIHARLDEPRRERVIAEIAARRSGAA